MDQRPGLNDKQARAVTARLLDLAQVRGPKKSFCPFEVARALCSDWRPMMPLVRACAAELVDQGRLRATQKGLPVHPLRAKGPIRLRLP
ncbi:MAG: DUF3253 domain-containing protein [Pseudomonadota bacterium]